MLTAAFQTISHSGVDLGLQTLETTESYILIRLRDQELVASRHRNGANLAKTIEQFTLSDGSGMTVTLAQRSTQGDGPFAGIVDLAFPLVPGFDLKSSIVLASGKGQLVFLVLT
ncbi:hypothetical protein [Psychromicrobium xiongbiense]|uniref:hypothetical protein n=1 Tax=Psychromicrobium xiongbiense TaxID=3051184 RepID=UPI002552890E|nr:hypothetical protein [Psychromicrobium sp. YIM S02556]